MKRTTGLLLACTLSFVPPVHAGPASGVPGSGAACGFVSYGSERQQSGFVQGGPWVAPDPTSMVSIACVIALVGPDGQIYQELSRTQSVPAQGIGLLPPTPVAYVWSQYDGLNLAMCTEITIYKPPALPGPSDVYRYDADPQEPGGQCDESRSHNSTIYWTEMSWPPATDV